MNVQAIIRKSFTETLTFTGVPSETLRKELFEKGFRFRNGQWYRNEQNTGLVDEESVTGQLAA